MNHFSFACWVLMNKESVHRLHSLSPQNTKPPWERAHNNALIKPLALFRHSGPRLSDRYSFCFPAGKDRTYRAGAGVPPNFWRLFASGGGLKVNASIVLRMHPLYLISWFLKWVKSALCPLNPDFFILRNCVQGFDHWVHSLAVPCRHLCDTYLGKEKEERNSELPTETLMSLNTRFIILESMLISISGNTQKVHILKAIPA